MRHYGFNCNGSVVPGPEIPDSRLPSCFATARDTAAIEPDMTAAPHPLIDEDEWPPWLGERMRDTTHHIHRAAAEAAAADQE